MIKVTRISPTDFCQIPTGLIDMTREQFIEAHNLIDEGSEGDVVAERPENGWREFFSITEHIRSEIKTVLAQKLVSSFVTFEVYEREVTFDERGVRVGCEVIAILNGQLVGFYHGKNFDEAKGNAWETLCNERGMNINDGSPDYDRLMAYLERQHHAALDAMEAERE